MSKIIYIVQTRQPQRYGVGSFLVDLFLTAITCGLWLIWKIFKAVSK